MKSITLKISVAHKEQFPSDLQFRQLAIGEELIVPESEEWEILGLVQNHITGKLSQCAIYTDPNHKNIIWIESHVAGDPTHTEVVNLLNQKLLLKAGYRIVFGGTAGQPMFLRVHYRILHL